MSVTTEGRYSERCSERCTDRYSVRGSDRCLVAEIEIEIEIEVFGRYSDHSHVRYSDFSNRLPPSLRSVAFENPYRTFAVLTNPTEVHEETPDRARRRFRAHSPAEKVMTDASLSELLLPGLPQRTTTTTEAGFGGVPAAPASTARTCRRVHRSHAPDRPGQSAPAASRKDTRMTSEHITATVAHNLRTIMAEANINQDDLAEKLRIPYIAMERKAHGKTPLTVTELCLIADLFGVPTDRLLRGARRLRRPA